MFQGVYPVREMIKRGWLEDTPVPLLEAQLMRFFRRNDVCDIPYLAHAAKKSGGYNDETSPEQLAWLFRVRQICSEMVVPKYSESKLREVVEDVLPRHMLDPEEARHVPRILSECGLRFAIVERLPKALIDGVCFWLDDASPMVGMTTRFDRIDNFWFVLAMSLSTCSTVTVVAFRTKILRLMLICRVMTRDFLRKKCAPIRRPLIFVSQRTKWTRSMCGKRPSSRRRTLSDLRGASVGIPVLSSANCRGDWSDPNI